MKDRILDNHFRLCIPFTGPIFSESFGEPQRGISAVKATVFFVNKMNLGMHKYVNKLMADYLTKGI